MNRRLIPNLVTTANILFGFLAILATYEGDLATSAALIIAAGICDLIDGRLARLLRASSEFGESYDTLSDLASFGIAPALLLSRWLAPLGPTVAVPFAFLYLIAVAYRLARFSVATNVATDGRQKNFFSGLSSPPAAATLSSYVIFASGGNAPDWVAQPLVAAGLGTFLALLMASRIPFPSFKAMDWKSPSGLAIIAIALTGIVLIAINPATYLFLVAIVFITSSLSFSLVSRVVRTR